MATALIGSRTQAEEVGPAGRSPSTFDHYGRLEDPTKALRRSVLRGCASTSPIPTIRRAPPSGSSGASGPSVVAREHVVALRYSLGLGRAGDRPDVGAGGGRGGDAAPRGRDRAAVRPRGRRRPRPDRWRQASRRRPLALVTCSPGRATRNAGSTGDGASASRSSRWPPSSCSSGCSCVRGRARPRTCSTGARTPAPPRRRARRTTVVERQHDDHGRPTTTEATTTTAAAAATYTVVSGDGWYAIAKKVDVARRQPPAGQRRHAVDAAARRRGPQGPAEGPADDLMPAPCERLDGSASGRERPPTWLDHALRRSWPHATPPPLRREARWWRMTSL